MKLPGLTRRIGWFGGTTVLGAVVFVFAGIIFWGGFNTAMEATNTLEFCISCHEMEQTVYREYTHSIHFSNRTGVRATCADCHVPKDWMHKVVRKVQASGEIYHKLMGTIDTPEKFEERRLYLANRVWATMKSNDSRECRNCHSWEAMSSDAQKPTAKRRHRKGLANGDTCIDCHKGIAHKDISKFYDPEANGG
ncbi:MAG: cytochrome c-type protein NapC [Sedimenticola sp.]|uniref:Cytochrome c-type protein n=2 Tax=Sedimenticola TaxID=349742 RepID=A0A558CRW9_9GAMM|nr:MULTISPECIES: NapC/NirT family cytochrome c [Gammaproteobacteria]PLY11777.1 MAG: cytochrome c-type protein NapC [Sedimenticola sp.]TVT51506.1 MAG: butanol dehydrogenase [Sedimenticola thiotaurini]KRW82290.1 NapC/NirT cytochrome c-like protein [Marinobacter sp. P4B1]PLX59658.1 MAG: cytochrome c-type protein NapC [Sedimenticola selenatireducens]TVO68316.1 butanol dehydrogenase [Sedimenticola selenatireducens]